MLRRGAKRARDRCQPGYRTRSVQQRQRKVWEIQVSVELRVSKCERIVIVPIPATIQPRTSKESRIVTQTRGRRGEPVGTCVYTHVFQVQSHGCRGQQEY